MPKTSRPRKAYKPGRVNPLAYMSAIIGTCKLTVDDRIRWQAQIDDALTAVARGQADEADWWVVFDACNIVEELVRMRVAADPDGLVQEAQDVCVQILDRQQRTGMRAVRAEELATLRALTMAWAELMDGITHAEKFSAEAAVAERTRRVLSAKKPPAGVRIIDIAKTRLTNDH